MYLNALGQPIIFINSLKVAVELLDKRANIYSDRPSLIVANEILSGGLFVTFLRYGDRCAVSFSKPHKTDKSTTRRWRRTRRAVRVGFTRPVVRDYHPILHKEAILLASALLHNPEAREKHFQRCSASATMSILYDYPTLETENDKTLKEIHAYIDRLSKSAAPGAHLVEIFPWMIHIPDRSVVIFIDNFSRLTQRYQPCQVET